MTSNTKRDALQSVSLLERRVRSPALPVPIAIRGNSSAKHYPGFSINPFD
jgi:hypothetical protein